jgi:ArsR family metal-binding transcriptional regulator
MAKSYLNSRDKNRLFFYAAMTTKYDEFLEESAKLKNPNKWEIKIWKTLRTYTLKLMDALLENIDYNQKASIIKQMGSFDIIVTYKQKAKQLMREQQELDDVVTIKTDDLYDIVNLAIASCSVCEDTGDDVANCKSRIAFLKYDIDVLNPDCGENGCPYRFGNT